SGSETLTRSLSNADTQGAKHGKEEFDREEQSAEADGQERRARAGEAEGDHRGQDQADGGALCGDAEARGYAAQFLGHADSQPLRTDWPSALELPQEQAQPHRAARAWLQGTGSRAREVELVGGA